MAEFASVYGRIDNGGAMNCCDLCQFDELVVAPGCTAVSYDTTLLEPGYYWFVVGADFSKIVDCNQPAGGPPDEIGDRYWMRIECVPIIPCPWDVDGDGVVGFEDLLKLLSNWGPCPT